MLASNKKQRLKLIKRMCLNCGWDYSLGDPCCDKPKTVGDTLEKQKELIKQMTEVIGFYGEIVNWKGSEIVNDIHISWDEGANNIYIGGKRARELQQSKLFKEIVG